jgi:hypothetical protein
MIGEGTVSREHENLVEANYIPVLGWNSAELAGRLALGKYLVAGAQSRDENSQMFSLCGAGSL